MLKLLKFAWKWKKIKLVFDEFKDVFEKFQTASETLNSARSDGQISTTEEKRIFDDMMNLTKEVFEAQRKLRDLFE